MLPSQQLPRRARALPHDDADLAPPRAVPTSPRPTAAPAPPRQQAQQSAVEPVQTCWICYTDSLEEPDRRLVHACSCSLVAHPDCLLAWLTTQAATQAQAPRCPVCAASITVRERTSDALRLYRRLRAQADRASLAVAVGGVAASAWFVAAAYGAWALKVFMGDHVTQALLLRHENGLPWRYWLNLPLIPFTLVLSRTPLIDSLLPFLPLTLVLSTHAHSSPALWDPVGLDDLTLRYPPSPTLTVCLLPWLRLAYLRLRHRVFHAVLGRKKRYRGLAGVFEEAAEDDAAAADILAAGGAEGQERRRGAEALELVATIEVEVDDAAAGADAHGRARREEGEGAAAAQHPPAPAAAAAQPALGGGPQTVSSRLRVGLGRLTSLVLGALAFPALSALAGSALFYLAARGDPSLRAVRLLRRALGVSALLAATSSPASSGARGAAASWFGAGWIRQLTQAPAGRRAGALVVDPKWVRNTLGAGLVLVLRDAVELTAGVLENRRRASRTIVETPFRPGRDAEDEATTSSAGRDGNGREAVVHNFL
ncbi:uncharacterized protein JCM10292_006550 [Rhodotorula paludigena]|uniref:uncharacterized protein n=1 Tax=Rhodotorula paludigena TaxID=86838 RepID=UPI00317FF4D4